MLESLDMPLTVELESETELKSKLILAIVDFQTELEWWNTQLEKYSI